MSLRSKIALRTHWKELKLETIYRNPLKKYRPHQLPNPLIVSLTSYPPRFSKLKYTIMSLKQQDTRADKIVLWIYRNDMPLLPKSVLNLVDDQFSIISVERDIKSYKKLLPALKSFPDASIVTADDDMNYHRSWLSNLTLGYGNRKGEVIGMRGHRITITSEGTPEEYRKWIKGVSNGTFGPDIMLTGVGGILYPPNIFHEEIFNESVFMDICPTCDDLWFYFMIRRSGLVCEKVGDIFRQDPWAGTENTSLYSINQHTGNDNAMRELVNKYGSPF